MKMKSIPLLLGAATLVGLSCANLAIAGPLACTGVNVGTSTVADVTLNGSNSTQCETVDGNSGMAGGNSSLIPTDGDFGPAKSWTQVGKRESGSSIVNGGGPINGITLTDFSFDGNGALSGTWDLGWTGGPAGLDILFSIHGGGTSGFFVFEGVALPANGTWDGTWAIDFLNNGRQNPTESNAQVWFREDTNVIIQKTVPEPTTLGLLSLGLAALGFLRRRKS
jgi:hypothetical protein